MYNFTIRIKQSNHSSFLYQTDEITISGITIMRKYNKFQYPKIIKSNLKKFGFDVNIKGQLHKVSGSNSTPTIAFKKEYLDIEVKGFPRFPCFNQDNVSVKNILKGYSYNVVNNGFPFWIKRVEILNIQKLK